MTGRKKASDTIEEDRTAFYQFVTYFEGQAKHEFMVTIGGNRLFFTEIGRNLEEFLRSNWHNVSGGSNTYVLSFSKETIRRMEELTNSDLYGCERCAKELRNLYANRGAGASFNSEMLRRPLKSWIDGE